ncbi:hypothetical protein N431DRAFT_468098 [Stipitochalara longipes BDJ]|nr:hypothetical protein N431DRAFT_468098 [Stipitochalara longipes BDJ]
MAVSSGHRPGQCRFEAETTTCIECVAVGLSCSYNEERKKRGPKSWRVERFREAAANSHASSSLEQPPVLDTLLYLLPINEASYRVTIEHLMPFTAFQLIMDDYLSFVYPVIPVVHIPSFQRRLSARDYNRDPVFLRFCLSISAVTVSSMPRKISVYGFGHYEDSRQFVTRAYLLVMASRYTNSSDWADTPSMDTLLCSYLLSCASHYTEKPSRAWMLMNESLQNCRNLEIWNRDGYQMLSIIDSEICKRMFWLLYIVQVHDRLTHISLCAQLGQDPILYDWEFLLPAEVSDEELEQRIQSSPATAPITGTRISLISGFIALIKVFLCVGQLISNSAPLSFAHPNPSWTTNILDQLRLNPPYIPHGPAKECLDIDSLRQMLRNLANVLNDLPQELQITANRPPDLSTNCIQYNIMKANIHVTRLFFQSTILERCSTVFYDSSGLEENLEIIFLSQEQIAKIELWKARDMIATELLDVLNHCTRDSLEANGASVVIKIRSIASTLLGRDDERIIGSDIAQRAEHYLQNFIEVLSVLDYSHRNVTPAENLT